MKIRIGKELHISWSILTQGENKPLEGRDLHLYLQDHNRRRRSLEFTTDANTLLVVIPANTLTSIGRYALILTENEGQEGQTAVDANPAFTLVETTREEDTNTTESPNLEVATINLATGNLTLRMVLQELFDGKDGGDMKNGDILPVLRDGELHRVSAKIGTGTGTGADCSAEIEALTAKVEENTANIASATTAASNALKEAQSAQAAASSASENAGQAIGIANEAKEIAEGIAGKADDALNKATEATGKADAAKTAATEAKRSADSAAGKADTATRMLRFSSIIYDANIEEQEEASISPEFLIVFVRGKGCFVASDGGKYYKVFPGSDDYNTTLDGVTKARQDRLFFIQSLEENRYYHYDGADLRLLTASKTEIAGRVWNEDNATPKAESYYGSLKALRDLPKRLGLGRYLVTDDRKRKKLDPKDSRKYIDGSPAKLDGSEGQCMWCWNGFYANIWHDGSRLIKAVTFDGPVGNDISIWIPAGGISWLGAGVIDRGDAPFTDKTKWKLCSVINNSEQFRGGGGVALDASKYSKAPSAESPQITMLGMPATNTNTTDFGTYARKRGEGWEANWFVARFVVEFLFEVIMGTENSQEAFNNLKDANGLYQGGLGNGVTAFNDWKNYNEEYPIIPTSVGLEAGDGVCLVEYNMPDASGGTYQTFNVPVFFGLVGAGYGHLWQWVRGILLDKGEEKSLAYVVPSMYAESEYSHTTVEGKICVAEYSRNSGFIKRKSYRGLCCMPTDTSGSSNTHYCCYLYTNVQYSKSICERAAGGVANIHTNGTSSTIDYQGYNVAKENYTSPLCYFTEDPIIPESQSIANNS